MRCFVAIELPDDVRKDLATLQKRLSELDRLVRWTRPDRLHLTLKFLGDVADGDLAAVCRVVQESASGQEPFELHVGGVGCFPPHGSPRIVWAGMLDPPESIFALQKSLEASFAPLGFPPEGRAYRPHLTAGRVQRGADRRRIRSVIDAMTWEAGGGFLVTELVLFQSVLGSGGPTYTALARCPLGPAG